MIVRDTNVISELMRPEPEPLVVAWMAAQPRVLLDTTRVSQAGIPYGIGALLEGRRRSELAVAAEALFAEDFASRILPFGAAVAALCPEIVRHAGRRVRRSRGLAPSFRGFG